MKAAFIRKATKTDIQTLVKLLKLLFSIEIDFVFDEEKQRKGLEMMLQDQENRCVLVAEIDQNVVGMCSAQLLVSTAEGGKSALIEDVVIAEHFRKQGIGRLLLSEIEKWALEKGAQRVQLLADYHNTSALNFYKQMGWSNTRLICLYKKPVILENN